MAGEPTATDVAIFIPSLEGGGAERVMVTLANAMASRGFAVDLVLGVARGPYLKSVSASVRIIDLKTGRMIKALLPLVRYFRSARPAATLAAITHASVVALVARALARSRTRLVVSERSTISVDAAHTQGALSRLTYALVPSLYALADGICTVSQAASLDLARFSGLPSTRVQTIYNPFDLMRIGALAAETPDHPWLAVGQPPVVLAIGRLVPQKDFSNLILAFKQLRTTHIARLLILGEGEMRASLDDMVAQHGLESDVQFPGFVENPYSWLARSKLFVLSSIWEGLPGVLIEALACGVPVVSTDCPSGPDEILQGGRWGRLVPVGDVGALASAMAQTLDTPLQQHPNVRQRAADFEQDRAVDAYLKILGMPMYPDIADPTVSASPGGA